jgi:Ni/Co efflux regulator RcnB
MMMDPNILVICFILTRRMSMKKLVLGLLIAAMAVPAAPALAQRDRSWSDQQREEDARANQYQNRDRWNGDDGDRRDDRARGDHDDRRGDWRHNNRGRHRGWGHDRGYNYRWSRGQQMGYNDWRNARRVDYRRYNLRQPPRGYEWRRNDDRYILGAVAGGLIISVILRSGR